MILYCIRYLSVWYGNVYERTHVSNALSHLHTNMNLFLACLRLNDYFCLGSDSLETQRLYEQCQYA